MKPLGTNIILKKIKNTQTKSGIILTDDGQDNIGEVIAVAKDCQGIHLHDQVIYKEFSAVKINIKKEKYIIIDQKDVLAIIEDYKDE